MFVLNRSQVQQALPMPVAIVAVREAYRFMNSDRTIIPERMHMPVGGGIDTILIMPGYLAMQTDIAGLKLATIAPGNAALGLPIVMATMLLIDDQTGAPMCMLDGSSLTAIRTGASAGLAAGHLARTDARTAAVIGTGVQAKTMLQAVCHVRRVKDIRAYDIRADQAAAFADEMKTRLKIPVRVSGSAQDAVRGADMVLCATTSTEPVVQLDWLEEGTFVAGIGSYKPNMRELDVDLLRAAKVVVDTRDGALVEAGDFAIPIERGLYAPDMVHAEMSELVCGSKTGREDERELTVYKAVGHGALDLAAAGIALAEARRLGLGLEIEL